LRAKGPALYQPGAQPQGYIEHQNIPGNWQDDYLACTDRMFLRAKGPAPYQPGAQPQGYIEHQNKGL